MLEKRCILLLKSRRNYMRVRYTCISTSLRSLSSTPEPLLFATQTCKLNETKHESWKKTCGYVATLPLAGSCRSH